MLIYPMAVTIVLLLVLSVLVCASAISVRLGRGIRTNLLCLAGIVISASGASYGWDYVHGDVGIGGAWSVVVLAGAAISFVTPLGGMVELAALAADVHFIGHGFPNAGAENYVLAALGCTLILMSVVAPLGFRLNFKTAGLWGRVLTVGVLGDSTK